MKRIRRLAKQNAYATNVSQHIRKLSASALTLTSQRNQGVARQESRSSQSSQTLPQNDYEDSTCASTCNCESCCNGDECTVGLFIDESTRCSESRKDKQEPSTAGCALEDVSLPQLCQAWVHNANALFHTREMHLLVTSTCDVVMGLTGSVFHVVEVAVHVACLPVTLPIHLIGSSANALAGTCSHLVAVTINHTRNALPSSSTLNEDDGVTRSCHDSSSPLDSLVHFVSSTFGTTVHHVAGGIQDKVSGIVSGLISPFSQRPSELPESESNVLREPSENTYDKENFLDRLRIDDGDGGHVTGFDKKKQEDQAPLTNTSSSDYSKSLLRVNDLEIRSDSGNLFLFIDLCPDFRDELLTSNALDALLREGHKLVSLAMFFPTSWKEQNQSDSLNWKPEGATRKLLKLYKKTTGNDLAWYQLLEEHTLIWSGTFQSGLYKDTETPLFWSRGVVPGSPKDIYDMLCDSNRTTEYNRFCLGRTDDMVLHDNVAVNPEDKPKVVKIVKSETRVPFTSLSVPLSTLMYGTEVDNNLQEAGLGFESFIIVSRSLTSGGAGCHIEGKNNSHIVGDYQPVKNEITWGVNLMRSVPNNPFVTDLINLSQVNSSLVPRFLTHKVGMMAVENSFNAMRSRKK